jgi:superfamily II DNA or RNA helicase
MKMCDDFLTHKHKGKSALVSFPTGTGKTAIIAMLASRASYSSPALVLSPSRPLCDQLEIDIRGRTWDVIGASSEWRPEVVIGLLPSDLPRRIDAAAQKGERTVFVSTMQAIATAQRTNLALYASLRKHVSIVLVDEGHREPAPRWAQAIRGLGKPIILFSATPYRNDLRLFDVDPNFITELSFRDAVKHHTIRDVAVTELPASKSAQQFAKALCKRLLELQSKRALTESAKVIVRWYKAIIEGQKADMVRPDSVRGLPAVLTGEADAFGFGRRTAAVVTLQIANVTLVGSLREKLAREQARATRLLDEVADLNREKVEIDVPQEVIGIAGLAA